MASFSRTLTYVTRHPKRISCFTQSLCFSRRSIITRAPAFEAASEIILSHDQLVSKEDVMEAKRKLSSLGCSDLQVNIYLDWGLIDYSDLSPSSLVTTPYMQQLPMAFQILGGNALEEFEHSEHQRLITAALAVFRAAARDTNKDGKTSFPEYVYWGALEGCARRGDPQARLATAFHFMHLDGSGYISLADISAWMKIANRLSLLPEVKSSTSFELVMEWYLQRYAETDSDHDGLLSLEEFLKIPLVLDLDKLFLKKKKTQQMLSGNVM